MISLRTMPVLALLLISSLLSGARMDCDHSSEISSVTEHSGEHDPTAAELTGGCGHAQHAPVAGDHDGPAACACPCHVVATLGSQAQPSILVLAAAAAWTPREGRAERSLKPLLQPPRPA